jgi:iron complex outermembrane receptor protein
MVVTRQELRRSGVETTTEAIQNLTSVFNSVDLAQAGMYTGGFANAALHGMPAGTLVLLDGRRLSPYGIQHISGKEQSNVDLESIPLAAIERIEVLSDGASSLYGTDAIAGVINIITRTDTRGFEVALDLVRPAGGVGAGRRASLTWGKGQLLKDGFSFRLTAEVESTNAIGIGDRPGVNQSQIFFDHQGQSYRATNPSVSAFTSPALLYSPYSTTNKMWSAYYREGQCTGNSIEYYGYKGGCRVNLASTYELYPEKEGRKFHASGELRLGDSANLFVDGLYSQQNLSIANKNWSSYSGRIVNKVGAIGYAELVDNGMYPGVASYFYQPDLPALESSLDKNLWRATVGVKGEWAQWNYQASLYRTQSEVIKAAQYDNMQSLGFVQNGYLPTALALQPLNAQNPLTAQLLDSRYGVKEELGNTRLTAMNMRGSRSLMEIEGKDVLLGVGLEAREESAGTQYRAPSTTKTDFSASRRVVAAHGELDVPITPSWNVIASLRHDQYSDVGSTTNGKLATRWAIDSQWAVRGSVGTGFRAPTVGQTLVQDAMFEQTKLSGLVCTPALTQMANVLTPTAGSTGVACRSNNTISVYTNGNPDLRPETSKQATLGLAFMPTRNLSFSVDYWRVAMSNTFQFESAAAALANPAQYASRFVTNPKRVLNPQYQTYFNDIALLLKTQNLGESVKEGLDLDARYRYPGDWGRWHLGIQATYMLQSKERAMSDAQWSSDLAAYSAVSDTVTPRIRSRWSVGLEQERLQWHIQLNHTGGYKDKDISTTNMSTNKSEVVKGRKVPSFVTADLMVLYKVGANTQLRFGVSNIMGKEPPLSFYSANSLSWGANSQYGNLLGRTVQLGVTHKF